MTVPFRPFADTHNLSERLQGFTHDLSSTTTLIPLDFVKDADGDYVCIRAIASALPTTATVGNYSDVYWEQMAEVFLIGQTDEEATVYYNTGTRAAPVWTASDTSITAADIKALIGDLIHSHTSSAIGTFTATAVAADTTVIDDSTGGEITAAAATPLYVAIPRGQTVAGVFTSENNAAATANVESVGGIPFPVVHNAVEEATLTITLDASALTNGAQVYVEPVSMPNRWGAQLGKLRSQSAGRVNGTFATSAPVDTLEIEHFAEDTAQIGVPLNTVLLLAGGTIPATAANGGVIASDTDPVATITSDTHRLAWAAGSVVSVEFQIPIPSDFDDTKDATLMVTAAKDADNNAVDIGISSSFDDGAAVADSVVDIPQATSTNLITIEAGDIPANPQMLTVVLTPGAHAGDAVYIYSIKLQYNRTHNLLPVYFDHNHATDTSRLQCVNPLAQDIYVPLASGRLLKITHSATAAADGALLRYDHDAAAGAYLISTLATTTCETGNQLGFWNWYGIYLAPVYVNETSLKFVAATPSGLANTAIPIWGLTGNREFKVTFEAIAAQPRAYFDDDGATASARILATMVVAPPGNKSVALETTERPFWTPPVGTISVTPTVNNSAALIP